MGITRQPSETPEPNEPQAKPPATHAGDTQSPSKPLEPLIGIRVFGKSQLSQPGVFMKASVDPTPEGYRRAVESIVRLRRYLTELCFLDPALLVESKVPSDVVSDGFPIPPASLRQFVDTNLSTYLIGQGTPRPEDNIKWFIDGGKTGANTVIELLARNKLSFDQIGRVLDFGCGCGRVIRHFHGFTSVKMYGSDCNRAAVSWCSHHLPFAQFQVNGLNPPLDYPDNFFDLCYVFSVLTHMPPNIQDAWMAEYRRILVPHGHLILSLASEKCIVHKPMLLQNAFRNGSSFVEGEEFGCSNDCSTFNPKPYVVESLASGFHVMDSIESGVFGEGLQDVYLMRNKPKAALSETKGKKKGTS